MNFGVMYNGRLPFLELSETYYVRRNLFGIYKAGAYIRYSSLFIEPSHLAQYLAPYLCMLLYGYKSIVKRNIILALIVTVSVVLSISGTSIALVGIIWLYFFLRNGSITRKKLFYIFAITIILAIAMMYLWQLPGIQDMILGFLEDDSGTGKIGYRVTRGFLIFLELPLFYKVFGIGYQCVEPASRTFGISLGYDVVSSHKEYLNDISSILISFGLIGFVFVLAFLYKMFQIKNKLSLLLCITCVLIMLSEATFGSIFLFLGSVIVGAFKNSEEELIYEK